MLLRLLRRLASGPFSRPFTLLLLLLLLLLPLLGTLLLLLFSSCQILFSSLQPLGDFLTKIKIKLL
jgi:hypothetical protein